MRAVTSSPPNSTAVALSTCKLSMRASQSSVASASNASNAANMAVAGRRSGPAAICTPRSNSIGHQRFRHQQRNAPFLPEQAFSTSAAVAKVDRRAAWPSTLRRSTRSASRISSGNVSTTHPPRRWPVLRPTTESARRRRRRNQLQARIQQHRHLLERLVVDLKFPIGPRSQRRSRNRTSAPPATRPVADGDWPCRRAKYASEADGGRPTRCASGAAAPAGSLPTSNPRSMAGVKFWGSSSHNSLAGARGISNTKPRTSAG